MTFAKKIMTMVLCGIMTTSSMVGISVLATEINAETSITMSLEEFIASPYLSSYYEGIYYCSTDNSAYINNVGNGITFHKVYAFNGKKVHATVTKGYLGENSLTAAEGYGCSADLIAGGYTYLSGNNWIGSSQLGDTSIRGYVTVYNKGMRNQYAIIEIVDSNGNIKQTFVQEVDRD